MKEKFWEFKAKGEKAELFLYGDIARQSWLDDDVTPNRFADELKAAGEVDEITVYINSGGGDIFAARAIANQLLRHKARVTAVIDGLCASAATIIACRCDCVKAYKDSTYMIHPAKMGIFDFCDSVQLKKGIEALDAVESGIVSLYAEKSGISEEKARKLMNETNWWTAEQAKEHGFVDEIIDGKPAVIENRGGQLFVNQVNTHISIESASRIFKNGIIAEKEDKEMEVKTVDELKKAYPSLVNALIEDAAKNAAIEERQRIRDIEEMTLNDEKGAFEAKFEKPVSAAEYAKTAVKNLKSFKDSFKDDARDSGIDNVGDGFNGGRDEFLNAIYANK